LSLLSSRSRVQGLLHIRLRHGGLVGVVVAGRLLLAGGTLLLGMPRLLRALARRSRQVLAPEASRTLAQAALGVPRLQAEHAPHLAGLGVRRGCLLLSGLLPLGRLLRGRLGQPLFLRRLLLPRLFGGPLLLSGIALGGCLLLAGGKRRHRCLGRHLSCFRTPLLLAGGTRLLGLLRLL